VRETPVWRIWLFAAALPLGSTVGAGEHPLHLAWRISDEHYSGWQYGGNTEAQEVNCVQFLEDIIQRLLNRPLRERERKRLLIQNVAKSENLQRLVERSDKRTRGIQHALISIGRGKTILPRDARPGDFVQYWYKKDSLWVGHAAIIQEVKHDDQFCCSFIYGAHESLNGVGVAGYMVTLNDPHMKVYIVRFR
jgi:hypothetical protein